MKFPLSGNVGTRWERLWEHRNSLIHRYLYLLISICSHVPTKNHIP